MNYFALRRRGDARPNLYLPTSTMAHNLWECALRSGMEHGADDDGEYLHANLETYFKVHVGKNIELEEFPKIQMFETPHIPNGKFWSQNWG